MPARPLGQQRLACRGFCHHRLQKELCDSQGNSFSSLLLALVYLVHQKRSSRTSVSPKSFAAPSAKSGASLVRSGLVNWGQQWPSPCEIADNRWPWPGIPPTPCFSLQTSKWSRVSFQHACRFRLEYFARLQGLMMCSLQKFLGILRIRWCDHEMKRGLMWSMNQKPASTCEQWNKSLWHLLLAGWWRSSQCLIPPVWPE